MKIMPVYFRGMLKEKNIVRFALTRVLLIPSNFTRFKQRLNQ